MRLKERIHELFQIWQAENSQPVTELEYGNPFQCLVAVVLSAQSTDVGVNKATKQLFKEVKTPQQMIELGEAALTNHIKTIGLYRNKAKNVIGLSKLLVENHSGEIPNDQKALEALPGVGRKTANVVRNVVFSEPTMAVDTHIFRVGNRLGIGRGKTPLAVEKALLKNIPTEYMEYAHHWLILHGRYTCVARKPKCAECKVEHLCKSADKTV